VRIARFAAGGDPKYGVVELTEDGGHHPDTVSVLTGDPIAMSVQLTGERKELNSVRLLAPVIPRSKIVAVGRNYAAHAAEMGDEVAK
jgi:2-keto-4-pentenoate hydratase/2-oxohepta-3-ene-1,7-dioic acid hydratase in catechol pathway